MQRSFSSLGRVRPIFWRIHHIVIVPSQDPATTTPLTDLHAKQIIIQPKKQHSMITKHRPIIQKTILALAVAAGLSSFSETAKAEPTIVIETYNLTMTPNDFKSITFDGFTIGSPSNFVLNSVSIEGGTSGSPGYSFGTYTSSYGIGVTLVGEGDTIGSSLNYATSGQGVGNNPFTGIIYEPIVKISGSDRYYGYIQASGNGSSSWNLNSVSWETTANKAITVVNTNAVPEPSTYALFGMGALALFARRRKVA